MSSGWREVEWAGTDGTPGYVERYRHRWTDGWEVERLVRGEWRPLGDSVRDWFVWGLAASHTGKDNDEEA